MASDTGIYWNILEILEKALDTGKYTEKRPIFWNILEKNILELGISKFDTGIYLKFIHVEHTSIWIYVMLNEIEISFT